MLIIGFIFDKKYNYKILLITFLTSIIVSGIGIGIFALGIKDFKIVDNMDGILNLKSHSQKKLIIKIICLLLIATVII